MSISTRQAARLREFVYRWRDYERYLAKELRREYADAGRFDLVGLGDKAVIEASRHHPRV